MKINNVQKGIIWSVMTLFLWSGCGQNEKTTPTGYKVVFHKENKGNKPTENQYVYFRYIERKGDQILFAMPPEQPDGKVKIPSVAAGANSRNFMIELLEMMSEGDSTTMAIPYSEELAAMYEWSDGDTIYYDVVVTAIKGEEEYQKDLEEERKVAMEKQRVHLEAADKLGEEVLELVNAYNAGTLKDGLQTTPTGLKKHIISEGQGEMPGQGDQVKVHYYGMLLDGKMFDNSIRRGEPFVFTVGTGQVIPGWDQALATMKEGEKAIIFLPSHLAYGEMGAGNDIPPNAELAFYIEFINILK